MLMEHQASYSIQKKYKIQYSRVKLYADQFGGYKTPDKFIKYSIIEM